MSSSKWFSVDKEGLAKVLGRKGKEFAVLELIQNAWDAAGVTEVSVRIEPVRGVAGRALLEVTDDSLEGFADLTHAYTLFAESAKKSDPLERGRFNLCGERKPDRDLSLHRFEYRVLRLSPVNCFDDRVLDIKAFSIHEVLELATTRSLTAAHSEPTSSAP